MKKIILLLVILVSAIAVNAAFREYFTTGEFNRLCKVTISAGKSQFAHEMSSIWMRSGIKIAMENDAALYGSEINELSSYITDNPQFVRQLMVRGFDTLIVKGKTTGICEEYELKKFANLNQYFIKRGRRYSQGSKIIQRAQRSGTS